MKRSGAAGLWKTERKEGKSPHKKAQQLVCPTLPACAAILSLSPVPTPSLAARGSVHTLSSRRTQLAGPRCYSGIGESSPSEPWCAHHLNLALLALKPLITLTLEVVLHRCRIYIYIRSIGSFIMIFYQIVPGPEPVAEGLLRKPIGQQPKDSEGIFLARAMPA